MSYKIFLKVLFVALATLALAACKGETTEVVTTVGTSEAVSAIETTEEEVVVAVSPGSEERTGAWVDEVVFTSIDQAEQAVTQLQSGDIDIYAELVSDPALYGVVQADSNLSFASAFGSYTELTFNPGGPVFTDGRLNPFALALVREAMNWLVDREHIVKEIYDGAGRVKYTPLNSAFPDYARYIDTCRALEAYYAYNPAKANEVISAEMINLGATLGADGKWMFNAVPVTIIMIIREDGESTQIGDYIADQLESIGFTVDRQYKSRAEASPIWYRSEPLDGLWHIYTGNWNTTSVSRDDATTFGDFYTNLGSGSPLWQGYVNDPVFYDVASRLYTNDFTSIVERDELFRQALELSMKDSYRVWLVDQLYFSPYNANLSVAHDLASGITGTTLWPFTVRWEGQVGGTVRIAQPGILVEPWNPVSGSPWIYDTMPRRATQDYGVISDPYTGLVWPQRIQTAEVFVQEGLPVGQTLDWFTLNFAEEIQVPEDAWADWDAVNQRFITVNEKFPDGITSLTKTVVVYENDLWDTVTWHDGSPISMGDFVMQMIMNFDRGKPESAIYDEAYVPVLDAFLSHFKGVRITSTDPLTIETYDDLYYLDAEYIITTWWPQYGFGDAPWQTVGLGVRAETAKLATFSTDKASVVAAENEAVEWLSFIDGPSLDILGNELSSARAEGYIPYATTMGTFVTAQEAELRYHNTETWYSEQGHFWLGTGPFFLNKIFPIEQTLTLARYPAYPDPADRWAGFNTDIVAPDALDSP